MVKEGPCQNRARKMKCYALNKFLEILGERLEDKEATSEIDRLRAILNARRDISASLEVLCNCLPWAFITPVIDTLKYARSACAEVLSACSDKEQVLDAVDDFLAGQSVKRDEACLMQALLLWETCDLEAGAKWAEEAERIAENLNRGSQRSWSRRMYAGIHIGIGLELRDQGKLSAAEAAFQTAVKVWPDLSVAWANLGIARAEQERLDEAMSAYERALKVNSKELGAWNGIGEVFICRGNLQKAENWLRKGIAVCGSNAHLCNSLGLVEAQQGKLLCAATSFRKALALRPESAITWSNLGLALHGIGRHEEGIEAFNKAIALDPWEWRASQNLIDYCLYLDMPRNAARELRRYLLLQLRRANEAPLWVARDFSALARRGLLMHYDLVAQADFPNRPPGCGKHIVDYYLMAVEQSLSYGLKVSELEPAQVMTNLFHIGTLWCSYAETLAQKGFSKLHARERLYAIKREIDGALPQQTYASGFASAWPELKAKMQTTLPEEFAHEMLRRESKWLRSVGKRREAGEVEDLRWRLKGNLWVHMFEYEREQKIEHLERVHYYMELLKGHTVLHKLADPRIMGAAIDIQKWNWYISSLPLKVDQTPIVDLRVCAASLPENSVALSFYFLRRELIDGKLLVIMLKPDQPPCLKTVDVVNRLEDFQDAARLLKQVHHQVAWWEKVPAIGRVFCELSGGKEVLKGRELTKAVAEWEKNQLRRAYKAILEGTIDAEELRGKNVYVSLSPEMYDIPFGLLLREDKFLNSIAKSISVVPIFSLRQFQRKGYFPEKDSIVLCLDRTWEGDANKRAESLSANWCNGTPRLTVECELPNFKGEANAKYNEWIKTIVEMGKVHIIGHHDAFQWSHSNEQRPNLGQFGRYLYEAPEKLFADVLSLEACWGGTWSEPEDLMGLFVSFLASGVSHVIASPYSVVPAATSGKLFDCIYRYPLETENGNIGVQIARAIREAAETVRVASPNSDDTIPTLWGALQLYGVG